MDKSITDSNQDVGIIRQLVKSNLQLQARVRMLEQILAACITGPRSWGRGDIEFVMTEGDGNGVFEKKRTLMLEVTIRQVLEESPLAGYISAEEREQVKKFEQP